MGKVNRKSRSQIHKLKAVDVRDDEDHHVDAASTEFIYDEVDQYYANEERRGLEKVGKLVKKPKASYRDDILGVASSSDEEEVPKKSRKKKKGKQALKDAEPIPLDSDLEERKEDEAEDGITSKWGKKRSAYYSADYVGEDWDDGNESDAEVAELEEKEALAIQQRMAQQLDEGDFGLDFITHLKAADQVKEQEVKGEEKIEVNLSKLTKRGKLDLLNKESPELLELIDDFKMQMKELKENIQPILNLVSSGSLPQSPGVDYIKAKYNIIMSYCTQISYYFMLKSKRISVQNHPVIKRLVQFRSLLHQLETAGNGLQDEITELLIKIKKKKPITPEEYTVVRAPPRKKLRILSKTTEEAENSPQEKEPQPSKKSSKKTELLTKDEHDALEFYSALNKRKQNAEEMDEDEDASEGEDDQEEETEGVTEGESKEEEAVVGKRAINYQIAKNKGLTPHRQKEQRNPRVKHRMKFRKAKIRRKGQIREARTELKRYDGEISGIKATVIRSVKLK